MLESSYNLFFGKLALRCLFEDYFEDGKHFSTKLLLKPTDDPHADLIATAIKPIDLGFPFIRLQPIGPLDQNSKETIIVNALLRLKSDIDDPHTFADLYVSSSYPIFLMRACAYYPKYGLGAFGSFPHLQNNRVSSEDYGVIGLRYESSNLSLGATLMPYALGDEFPKSAWLVSKIGRLIVGVQYDPQFETREDAGYRNLKNWNYSIGYGLGIGSPLTPLSPSFNFGLELAQNSQFTASFYQHVVVQRRVKNPFKAKEVVGITNYIDFGFELQTSIQDSTFQVAASWQANKNILLKAKAELLGSLLCLSFKSWWKPSFTFSMSAIRDRTVGKTSYGFGLCIDNVREASYQRADPKFLMLTPNKELLAEGTRWNKGSKPLLQSNVDSGNFDEVPMELRPSATML